MKKSLVAVTLAALVVVGCIVQSQNKTDPTLNKLAADWAAAFNARNASKIALLYAEDAVVMPPNKAMIKGRAAIEAHFKGEIDQGPTNFQLNPFESAMSGSQAFEVGTTTVTMPGGETDHGKYLVILKRVGTDWKIAYDIYNGDAASAPLKK
jgi:uncharacterized protein (TIGR02246 family)